MRDPSTAPTGEPAGRPSRLTAAGLYAVLAVAVLVPYAGSLGADFAWLDHREIVEGALLVDGWSDVVALVSNDGNYEGYHRPLYNLMHSLDRAVWGLDPFGFHLSSLLLHAVCVGLALRLALALGLGTGTAMAIAALFGLHPVNTAVAGLIHSKADLLSTGFLLGAGSAALAGLRGARGARALSLVLFFLAAMSKETAYVFPLLVTLGLGFGERRSGARRYLGAVWGLTILLLLHRVWVGGASHAPNDLGLVERLATFTGVYVDYVRKLVLPLSLSVCDTVTAFTALGGAAQLRVLGGFAALVVLQVVAWRRHPSLRPWLALFNVGLLPVCQAVPILHFRADRFLYLSSLGFAGLVVQGCVLALGTDAARRRALAAGAVALAVGYGVLVARRVELLRDDPTLFGAEIRRTPDYREGLAVLGRHYQREGRYDLAGPLLERALTETPGRLSYVDLNGTVLAYSHNLLAEGRPEDVRDLVVAHGRSVTLPEFQLELAYNAGVAAWRLGDDAAAIGLFEVYRETHPDDPGCLYLLGMSAARAGRTPLARDALESYLRAHPEAEDRPQVEAALQALPAE